MTERCELRGKMPYRADLELARIHLNQIEKSIEKEELRIRSLQANGQPTKSADDLLNVLSQSRALIQGYIERTTPAGSADNPDTESQPN
jgi:hypothetical protein